MGHYAELYSNSNISAKSKLNRNGFRLGMRRLDRFDSWKEPGVENQSRETITLRFRPLKFYEAEKLDHTSVIIFHLWIPYLCTNFLMSHIRSLPQGGWWFLGTPTWHITISYTCQPASRRMVSPWNPHIHRIISHARQPASRRMASPWHSFLTQNHPLYLAASLREDGKSLALLLLTEPSPIPGSQSQGGW